MLSNTYSPFSPTLTTVGQLRQPRAIVVINGFYVLWVNIKIVTTTFYVADSYSVEIPLYGQPAGFNMSYLSTLATVSVQIYIGFPGNPSAFTTSDLDLLMTGDCDEMVIDPLRAIVTFTGRDLTSRLIDTKTYAKYPNRTASNIVTLLANEHGLGTSRITATKGTVGTFYNDQNTVMTKETTEWDLITFLAQQYNFAAYVEGNDLVFGPKPTLDNTVPFILQYQAPTAIFGSPIFNGMSLNFSRSFTVAKDVTVNVRVPYSPLTGRAFTQHAGKTNPSINAKVAGNQVYNFTYPGLTPAQALATAQQLLKDITLNELKLTATMPGTNELKKSSLIKLLGTGSRFDQFYYTDTITRTFSAGDDGYNMTVNAKNGDVNSQVNL